MNKLDILAIGSLLRAEDGTILQAHSTSTLITSDNKLIVVDTSSDYMRPGVKTSFKQLGVFMKDVDTVVLTHMHPDHMGNLDLYPNAEVYVHSGNGDVPKGFKTVNGNMTLAKGVELVHTPGHTQDSMSVFVDGTDMKYAIVGDAIPLQENYEKMVPPGICVSKEVAMKSIKTIVNFADVIVPGHGAPFVAGR